MTTASEKSPKANPSLMASPLYWLAVGPPSILVLLAFLCSWPLGPEFVDEGGITKLRLAIALIAMALFWGILMTVVLLLQILRRLEEVSTRLSDSPREFKK